MDLELKGKNVLITGSTKGIGLGIAKKFSEAGCRIVLNGRSINGDKAIKSIPGSNYVSGDVSTEEGAREVINNAVKVLGSLDVLICNVGSGASVKPGQENLTEWHKSFKVNFSALHAWLKQLLIIWKSHQALLYAFLQSVGPR